MLNLLKTLPCGVRRRGSALLIVLGFLSFMIISGVSFAIYMRIERQASSNYRHAVNGRHVLNTALARAMEEVDAELRLKSNKNLKFPDWPGRVLASAIPDEDDVVQTGSDARVLSLEALSFLPPFLVNDVRRYAVRQENDQPYEGAKWRKLEGEVNGRYAYVCVNVSDMLDVNKCRAQYRDATTNRVSLGHLFKTDDLRTKFDEDARKDLHYFSLQDFYSARYEQRDESDLSSPFHMYIVGGNFTPFENPELLKQVFITDSIAKPEPVSQDACNIWLNPPFAPNVVNDTLVDNALSGNLNTDFLNAFKKAVQSPIQDANNFAATIKDYVDEDCVPSRLNIPTLERVPMVSEIVLDNGGFCPKIVTSTRQVGDPARDVTFYSVQLFGESDPPPPPIIREEVSVELVWPFKLGKTRPGKDDFDLELECYLSLHRPHQPMSTTGWPSNPNNRNIYIPLTHTRSPIPKFWAAEDFPSEQQCYETIDAEVTAPRSDVVVDIVDSDGNFYNGFAAGQEFSVSFVIFARVRTRTDGEYVDCAPQGPPNYPDTNYFEDTPKLYFQTDKRAVPAVGMNTAPMPYLWTGLEVADPRFNHNAANWVPNQATPGNCKGVNASTTKLLTPPLQGRDTDIFMFVSDSGDNLMSPGELGFIVRPDNFKDPDAPTRDFHTADLEPVDKEYMFRTIRLYDHGGTGANEVRDEVYKYFYAERPDGTLPGSRVNPLSDIDEVLEAAIWDTPLDYWIASDLSGLSPDDRSKLTVTRHANWVNFRDKWAEAMVKVLDPKENPNNPNKVWSRTVADYYGDQKYFKWYSEDRKKIFEDVSLQNDLHEIDRKMLFSFSLDSFSDRQQLFLYFIRAEVTMPAFGGGSGMQSLAGGRAVALVWRDPYPRGFVKDNDDDNANDAMDKDKDWYPKDENPSPDDDYKDPWQQYPGRGSTSRYQGYHDTRVLFFKQLGQ